MAASGTLSVFKFYSAYGADSALALIQDLQSRQMLELLDAAVVSWQPEKSKPRTRQLVSTAGIGALDGTFWGMLFGLIFFVPLLGAALGAAAGALAASFVDFGIDDKFIKNIRQQVTPGTSALFLLTRNVVLDKVADEFKSRDIRMELISSSPGKEQESKLRDVFGS